MLLATGEPPPAFAFSLGSQQGCREARLQREHLLFSLTLPQLSAACSEATKSNIFGYAQKTKRKEKVRA